MRYGKKIISLLMVGTMIGTLCGCSSQTTQTTETTQATTSTSEAGTSEQDSASTSDYAQDNEALTFNTAKWNYDETNNVYWQISVQYSASPEDQTNETMGIYVPGEYMNATANSDGTYTCTINASGKLNEYTSATAPIIFPIDTPGYIAQAAPTSYEYDSISSYLKAGFVYVVAGMRGRASMMGTADEQAYSGGGAQSTLAGATGNSPLYYPYLESIGAAMTNVAGETISDAVAGSMDWCPITSLDYADEAYEWNMGQYFSTDTRADSTFTSALSDDMAKAFATYINDLGLKSEDGTALTLSESDTGIYNSGTYYDYILKEIETSKNQKISGDTMQAQL